jgi:hypothetical protein
VADEILTMDDQLKSRQFDDLNHFFGFNPDNKQEPWPIRDAKKHDKKIVEALFLHVIDGGKFNAATELRPIAKKIGVSQKALMNVYSANKEWLKSITQNQEINHAIAKIESPGFISILAKHIRDQNNS